MKPRQGFTLLELITVMIIVGLLAAIAVSRFWAVKERSFKVAMKDGLRTAAVQQERYFDRNMAYAANVTALPDFDASQGVTITIRWSANNGWAAQAEHVNVPGQFCGYFTGPAPVGVAAPATESGVIACDD